VLLVTFLQLPVRTLRVGLIPALGPMRAIIAASILAVAVQPAVFLLWFLLPLLLLGAELPLTDVAKTSLFAAIFAVPFVLLIGIPAALLLRRVGRFRWLYLAIVGFLAAALPVAVNLPGGSGYSSAGNFYGRYVSYVVAGEPTIWGWLSYAQSILCFGLHGLVGASVFYVVVRRSMGPNNSFKPMPLRGTA
jgi:hypothetical protein